MAIHHALASGSMRALQLFRSRQARGIIVNEHTLSAAETAAHVAAIARWFDFIHHDDLPARLGQARPRPFCLLTFDDGKRSNFTDVAPVLERLGVPAAFYVTTCFLTDRRPLWFDRHHAITQALGRVPPELALEVLKQLPLDLIEERLDRASAGRELNAQLQGDDVVPMSWDQARELARRGFTIGAHGAHHTVLTRQPEALAVREIRESIAEVTRRIGMPCRSFAFPNGNYTARLARVALECGVGTVMTTEPVWVEAESPCWRLPRVQLMRGDGPLKIALKFALASTGRVLPNPDGTGRLYARINRLARALSSCREQTPPQFSKLPMDRRT